MNKEKKVTAKLKTKILAVSRVFLKYWFTIAVFLIYLFFSTYYMGPSITHCTDRLNGLGDSSAGPVWENGLRPEMPLAGGFETATNYPVGENLYTPVRYSAIGQTVVMRSISKVFGSVCGYNVFNLVSYLTTALAMFGFILYLTKNRWIGLLAGYVVAFSPYVQSKIGGHPSYGFASLLILALWATLHALKTKRLIHGAFLSVIMAFCMYFDPYFVLLVGTTVGPVIAVWLVYAVFLALGKNRDKQQLREVSKVLSVSFALLIVLISPLIYIRVSRSQQIDATTTGSRGNVLITAQQCSNMPLDYILPDPRNQILADSITNYTQRNVNHRHWCGFGESRVSISLTAMAVVVLGFVIFIWESINKRRLKLSRILAYPPGAVLVLAICAVAITSLAIGLPPYIHGLIMPSGIILKLTTTWRIFAREYLVLNIAVVILFSIILKYFSEVSFTHRKYVVACLYGLMFMFILFEYQINTPFLPLTFSYSQDTPQVYKEIRDNKDIKAIAEYPLDRIGIEYDSVVYYMTMQTVHGKKIFNSVSATDPRLDMHTAMKDITDPQTIPALRTMGVRYIVIHGESPADILSKTGGNLRIIGESNPPIFGLTMVRPGNSNEIVLANILDGPKVANLLVIKKGFVENLPLIQSPLDTQFEVVQDAELKLTQISKKPDNGITAVCFDAKMSSPQDTADLTVIVDGKGVQTYQVTDAYTHIRLDAKMAQTIRLHTSTGHNMRLNNLGCKQQ